MSPRRRRWSRAVVLVAAALALAWIGEGPVLDALAPLPADLLAEDPASLRVVDADGTLLRILPTAAGERCWPVRLDEVSPVVIAALLESEDDRFRTHAGVDHLAVLRALHGNLRAGAITSGASTITMQLARIMQPRPRGYRSKLLEMLRARQLERLLDKDAILEAYLNRVPWGGTLRGVEAASRYWFGRPAAMLAPSQAATLVAMLPAPSARAPTRDPAGLRQHRDALLQRMAASGRLDLATAAIAARQELGARPHAWPWLAPHACDRALRRAHRGPELALDLRLELQRRVEALSADAGVVDGLAVVVCERGSGRLRALLGSADYRRQPFDAASAHRAAGSTLKPFLYALAFAHNQAAPRALVEDRPGSFDGWRPANFDREFRGRMPADQALAASRNLPAVRLLRELGGTAFGRHLGALGLGAGERLPLSAALGAVALSPVELARAYARAFPPGNDDDAVLRALRLAAPDPLLRPGSLAWKTGTSSDRRDAWAVVVGATQVVVVWRGRLDGGADPDLVGARLALPLAVRLAGAVDGG